MATKRQVAEPDLLQTLVERWEESREIGPELTLDELTEGHPELVEPLRAAMDQLRKMDWLERAFATTDVAAEAHGDGEDAAIPVKPAVEPSPKRQVPWWPCSGSISAPRCADLVPEEIRQSVPCRLGNRYSLDCLIAIGGHSHVWRGRDSQTDTPVALKVSPDGCLEEATRVCQLKHPNIIQVLNSGREGNFCYIVFELIDGIDLAQRLQAGRLPWRQAVDWLAQIGRAVGFAHEHGWIHRDIKPGNILVRQCGRPVLADFGIAVTTGQILREQQTTVGTLAYMSPEQLTGSPIDHRTDVYSLGVVLFEALTGTQPFVGGLLSEVRRRILASQVPPWPSQSVPVGLQAICQKAMARQPAERYPSAVDFAQALERWRDSAPATL